MGSVKNKKYILMQNSELSLVQKNIFLKQSQKYVFILEIQYHIKLILQILKFYNDFSRSNENSKIYRFLLIGAKMEFTISSDKEEKKRAFKKEFFKSILMTNKNRKKVM